MNVSELVNKSEVLDIWNNYWITDMTTLDAENQLRELATVELKSAPQLNENQQIKTNNNLLKINDLAFELQHGTVLTNEQWEKVEKIYKLSLMGDEEEE
jgi:hypothetical protein